MGILTLASEMKYRRSSVNLTASSRGDNSGSSSAFRAPVRARNSGCGSTRGLSRLTGLPVQLCRTCDSDRTSDRRLAATRQSVPASFSPEAGGPLLLMLVTAITGRIFFGRLADMIGPLLAWMLATTWQTCLMLGFMQLGSLQAFWIFVVLYGFGYGGVMTGVLVSIRALTPQSIRASLTGIVLAFAWLGHAAGGW